MFTAFIIVLHIVVCVALILIILLQSGKGADIGAVFGGGSSQTVFGSSGATTFLSKVTIAAAVIFMITSIVLTYFAGRQGVPVERSIMEQTAPQVPAAPATTETDAQKGQSVPGASDGATKSEPSPAAPTSSAPVPAPQASPPAQPAQNQ